MAKKPKKPKKADASPKAVRLKPKEKAEEKKPPLPPQPSPQEQFNEMVAKQLVDLTAVSKHLSTSIDLISREIGSLKQQMSKPKANPTGIAGLDPKIINKLVDSIGKWLTSSEGTKEPSTYDKWRDDFFKEYMTIQMDGLKVDLELKKLERQRREKELEYEY